jgi:TP53 regulating kinase-like protein
MLTSLGEIAEPRLIYKGAEAEIYLENWHGQLAIRKSRVVKPYRISELDNAIRRSRTAHEATMMQEVRKLGVSVPSIQHVDPESWTLIMEYIRGPTLKEELYSLPMSIRQSRCHGLGEVLGLMHEGGIVHGDLTISNVLSEDGKLFMIDFGLGGFSDTIEDRGVDLLLLNRAIKSTHYSFHIPLFEAFLKGYSEVVGKMRKEEALSKMREIERRGRYFERA